ncbi:eukaryotic translation initiation factor 4E transporter isoform X1 [Zeugodacus cucurbitae]|uniref:Protein cup n=1 Tax=Zeugodacus cucurbitae TaxID=28588 RepID=A0A0A1XI72_ZEUCU|nr:eukaryotic translation initiation factor 4E transporter isoform X1 [Zeugodacus cucurbitae]XP_028901406.1 eukaryotic translation initiation factor 4E transporter isoform X1 [Zeugodacus cucurbitae]XP_028901408.1 eukaryotic translation initiation factor 4E transporter isoform X1 [Zeugodacus cucurbitae]XP_028901410.1 eukaryotic translation initiation factor 4E transporter isoform X1 [Zeugodacus cucurbitae]XP_028901411.1 eukaryotic translation initiation factor 4E transporter isoform X1 [Zeugodac
MNTSEVSALDMSVKCQGPLKLYYYQLPEAISDNSNSTGSNCDNVKRYSRSKLYDLRNETHSRRRPEYVLRAELQSLGVWKFNTSGNVQQNGSGSGSEGTASSSNACVANHTAQLSSSNLSVRRSPSRRETTGNISNSSQHNLSHHNLHKTYIDHRSISSAHLMPAFAKRRIAASSVPSSNTNIMGAQNLSSSAHSSYGPNSPTETRSQTPTEIKDGLSYPNIFGGNSSHVRQRNKDQLYDYRQRGSNGGTMTGDDNSLFLSPQRKLLEQDREREREQELQSNSRRLSSPIALGSSRHSHNNGGITQERRIGSGRLLPRDVNWDYRASQDRDKGQSLISAPVPDKESLAINHLGPPRSGGRYSDRAHERTSSGNGYSERRHLERRSGGGDDNIREKYDYAGNAQTPNPHGGGNRRDGYGTDLSSNQHSVSHNRRRNQKYHDRNEEPEWFSSGPTSQHDTIELRGFEEMDDQYHGSTSIDTGNTKRTTLPNSSRKISESSSPLESGASNLSNSKSKEQLHPSLQQDNESSSSLNLSPTILTIGNSPTSFENRDSLREEESSKESGESINAERSVRSSVAIEPTLPDFMIENEEKSKNASNSRDPEFNFDVFLNPNLDPLKHSLMRGDKSNNENELIGSSRFSRWFANKTGINEVQPPSGNDNTKNIAMDLVSSETKNETNTLMEFLNKLPALPDSVITQKVVTAITSVEELEARMGVMNTANEIVPEAHNLDMPNKKDQDRVLDIILPVANEPANPEQPQAGEIEAFKKLLEQLGSGNKQLQQQQKQLQQPLLPSNIQSTVLISPKNRTEPMPPLNIMPPGAALAGPNLSQQVIIKNDDLKKVMHTQTFHQQHQNNDISILSQAQPIPLSVLFANHPQKRLEQNLFHGLQRGDVSIHVLEHHLNNPSTSLHVKEVISAVLRDTSTMAALTTNIPQTQQNSGPIGHQQQHSPICNNSGNLMLHHGPINATIDPLQQQQILQQIPNSNVMISGQTERISLLPHQSTNHQAIPSQREIQFHTHTIMQNAMLKKKIEEQQDSIRRRQEKHPQSNNMLGLSEVDAQQKNMQQMHLSNSMQQQQSTTQQQAHVPHTIQQPQQHQSSRHINSPTPLAFTPTSVLRKMTADKDNTNSNSTTQHHTATNSLIQHQNKTMAQNNFINSSNNQHQMQQPISTHPRMILGGNHSQQQQQMSTNNPVPPQSLNQTSQQQPGQPLRNSMAPMKWPLHLVNQNVTAIKPMGRPILKAPLPPQSVNQQQQQMPQISPMIFNKLDFQQMQQQLLKNNQAPQHVLNQSTTPFSQHAMVSQQPQNHSNIIPHVQHQQQLYQQQRVLALQRHQQQQLHLQQQLHQQQQSIDTSNRNICMQSPRANDSNGVANNAAAAVAAASIINYQRDGGLSPTSNQLAQWFSPELLAQASAGKLPLLNMNQALSLEEFERNIQHSSTAVHN